jgi:hypothetical protein
MAGRRTVYSAGGDKHTHGPGWASIGAHADPKALIDKAYETGRTYPRGRPHDDGYGPPKHNEAGEGSGLVPPDIHNYEVKLQRAQFREDQQMHGYHNDTADDWRRGMGKKQAMGYGGYYSTAHPKATPGGSRNTAKGRDISESPWSAAAASITDRETSGDFKGKFQGQRNDIGYKDQK